MPRIEVLPNTKTQSATPGWAYVLEPAIDPSKQPLAPTAGRSNKRAAARNAADILAGAHSKTQAAKVRARLEELDRDNPGRWEVSVPDAVKKELNAGRWKMNKGEAMGAGVGKQTQAVRKILGSEKAWTHYALDLAAQQAQEAEEGGRRRRRSTVPIDAEWGREEDDDVREGVVKTEGREEEEKLTEEEEELLKADIPEYPTRAEIEKLIRGPPLSFAAAAAPESEASVPFRKFCDMCSYWGMMKCSLCGSYICSLHCKMSHDAAEHPHR